MKVAIVVLVILVIAFIVASGHGAPKAKAMPENSPRLLKWFGARYKPQFDFSALTGECFDKANKTFRVAQTCVVRFKESTTKFRQLTLQVKQGVAASMDFKPEPADDSGLSFRPRKLRRDTSETLILPAVGGRLTITCSPAGTSCSVNAE